MTTFPSSSETEKKHIVLGLVLKEDQVLLIRSWKKPTLWQLPGGWMEQGESEIEAIEREVQEETGIFCKAERFLGQRNHPLHGKEISYWLCLFEKGEIAIQDTAEIAEAMFVSYSDALQSLGGSLFAPLQTHLQLLQNLAKI